MWACKCPRSRVGVSLFYLLDFFYERLFSLSKLRSKLTPKTLESKKVLGIFCPDLNEICDDFVNVIKQKRNSADNILNSFEQLVRMMTLEAACTLILGRRNLLQETTDKNLFELGEATKHLFEIFRDIYYGNKVRLHQNREF